VKDGVMSRGPRPGRPPDPRLPGVTALPTVHATNTDPEELITVPRRETRPAAHRLPWAADAPGTPAIVGRFDIVVVCRANEARSPLIERLLSAELDRLAPGDFRVTSCGTRARVGASAAHGTLELLRSHGIDASDHRARQLVPALVDDADLVVTAERSHSDQVLDLAPGLLKRTFTFLELAELAVHAETAALAGPAFVERAAALRAGLGQDDGHPTDLDDPVSTVPGAFELLDLRTQDAVDVIARALAGAS
jgi:protein-tyrosine phosphatase